MFRSQGHVSLRLFISFLRWISAASHLTLQASGDWKKSKFTPLVKDRNNCGTAALHTFKSKKALKIHTSCYGSKPQLHSCTNVQNREARYVRTSCEGSKPPIAYLSSFMLRAKTGVGSSSRSFALQRHTMSQASMILPQTLYHLHTIEVMGE